MAQVNLAIDQFKAALIKGGARPNLFRVIPTFPTTVSTISPGVMGIVQLSSFMIKAASIPAQTIQPIEMKYMGRTIKLPGDRAFEDWNITVINDGNFAIKNAFERWSNYINGHVSNLGVADNGASFMSDWTLEHLDKAGNIISTYRLVGCWPQQIAAIELNWETENSIEEFQVTLSYQYFTNALTTS